MHTVNMNLTIKVPFRRGWVKGRGFAKSTWKSLDFTDILWSTHQPRTFLSALAATRPKIYPFKENRWPHPHMDVRMRTGVFFERTNEKAPSIPLRMCKPP